MQKRSDDRLVAYLDGELEPPSGATSRLGSTADPAARERLRRWPNSANLVRRAYRRCHATSRFPSG